MTSGLFVTGTGTGVGKTVVTAALVKALKEAGAGVDAKKPFATGIEETSCWQEDDAKLLAAAGNTAWESVGYERFLAPLAPLTAAELECRNVDVAGALHHILSLMNPGNVMIVEGVGGAAVPLAADILVSDFAAMLNLPLMVVARTDLGTINHTLLTLEHLRARKCQVAGVVFVKHGNGALSLAESTGPGEACRIAKVRNFGIVPFVPDLEKANCPEAAARLLPSRCEAIQQIVEFLGL